MASGWHTGHRPHVAKARRRMERFETVPCHAEQILDCTMCGTETLDLRLGLELPHLALPLPRVLTGGFGPVVVVLSGSMGSRRAQLATGGHVASQLVGDQLGWRSALPLQQLAEDAPCWSRVHAARDEYIQHVSMLVNRSPEMAPLAADRDENLVHMPDVAKPALAAAQGTGVGGAELDAPLANVLVRDRHA